MLTNFIRCREVSLAVRA